MNKVLLIEDEQLPKVAASGEPISLEDVELLPLSYLENLHKIKQKEDITRSLLTAISAILPEVNRFSELLSSVQDVSDVSSADDVIAKFVVPITGDQLNLSFWIPLSGELDKMTLGSASQITFIPRGTLSLTILPTNLQQVADEIRPLLRRRIASVHSNYTTYKGESLKATSTPTMNVVRFLFLDKNESIRLSQTVTFPKGNPHNIDLSLIKE